MDDAPPHPALLPRFGGFSPEAFAFLRELADRQDRTWFQANTARYAAELRGPMTDLVADLSDACGRKGLAFRGDPKRAVFRIHRDIRFSKDKRPYRTHIGAALSRGGDKTSPGVLYLHVHPAGSFAAAGFYRPAPDALAAFRTRIAEQPVAYRTMRRRLEAAGLDLEPDGDELKRVPRGFEHVTAADLVEALRRRSFIVRRPLMAEDVASASLIPLICSFAEAAVPLLAFGWDALR